MGAAHDKAVASIVAEIRNIVFKSPLNMGELSTAMGFNPHYIAKLLANNGARVPGIPLSNYRSLIRVAKSRGVDTDGLSAAIDRFLTEYDLPQDENEPATMAVGAGSGDIGFPDFLGGQSGKV